MTDLALHLVVFITLGAVFLLLPLIAGRFLRPHQPTADKLLPYECGEPSLGSNYVQFDSRYYVVALLFLLFDVEVAFFFRWAKLFGTATQLADSELSSHGRQQLTELIWTGGQSIPQPLSAESAFQLALFSLTDLLFFFGLLLVGFAYIWQQRGLDWVRSLRNQPDAQSQRPSH